MAAPILVKSLGLLLFAIFVVVKKYKPYTWDWQHHLVSGGLSINHSHKLYMATNGMNTTRPTTNTNA